MANSSMLHVRLDDDIKSKAQETLGAMGLSVSDAVRLFLHRVVADQAIPFEVRVPNAATRAAMAEVDDIAARKLSRFATSENLLSDLKKNGGQ